MSGKKLPVKITENFHTFLSILKARYKAKSLEQVMKSRFKEYDEKKDYKLEQK